VVEQDGTLRKCKLPCFLLRVRSVELTGRDEYLPIGYFDKIYLIDLCEPLLDIARKRFAAKGWKNVLVLCQDASRFVLPEWESGELDPRGSLTAITLSYSLSMVSSKHPANWSK
jgi:hypothetical protein